MDRLGATLCHISAGNAQCSFQTSRVSDDDIKDKVCVIVGMGPGVSMGVASHFGKNGFVVVMARRNADKLNANVKQLQRSNSSGRFIAHSMDARKEEEVKLLFDFVQQNFAVPSVVIFNIGANVPESILSETKRKFVKIWEMACLSGFLVGREAAQRMMPHSRGTIIFTGASASLRGKANFGSFGSAKAALRSLAQSMARELGPSGIHVCHVIIDGPVDNPQTREFFGASMAHLRESDFLKPVDIGSAYYFLHCQAPSAWTFELDLRTKTEQW